MFVSTNTIKALKSYFRNELSELFSANEINLILKQLVLQRFNLSPSDFLLSDDRLLSESDLLFFRSAVKRLQKNEPFQYVLGETEFYGLVLQVDERVLIPRPETEELVDWIVKIYKNNKDIRGIDVCTGSGCIALALKSMLKDAEIIGTDVSEGALQVAKRNADHLALDVGFYQQDILSADSFHGTQSQSLDFVVSNPPYIPHSDKSEMLPNVLDFEPSIALFVENEDPLIFYKKISDLSIVSLRPHGNLFFEIHEEMGGEMYNLLESVGFINIELRKDLQGKVRMIKGQKP